MADPEGLRRRLDERRPVLMDGPTGTELDRRGVDTSLSLWSAQALRSDPDVLRGIHIDYVAAGAELHTANTFRTNPSTLRAAGLPEADAGEMVTKAVQYAREAIAARPEGAAPKAWVLGSLAPIGDCYRPDEVPDQAQVVEEHTVHARSIAAAGADGLLVETMNTLREAQAAVQAARSTGLPVLVSFVVGRKARLLSGEPMIDAARAAEAWGVEAVLVNCSSLRDTTEAVHVLRSSVQVPFGAYANRGTGGAETGWETGRDVTVDEYVAAAEGWVLAGARFIGSCCGTTPAFTRALHDRLEAMAE